LADKALSVVCSKGLISIKDGLLPIVDVVSEKGGIIVSREKALAPFGTATVLINSVLLKGLVLLSVYFLYK
jgi:hypothetical protein